MADENYINLYVDEENDKEGVVTAGRDVILLDAPEVLLSPDTPLLTDAQDVAGAINELFSSGGEGGDDWQPPEWWIPVPEPAAYEIYFLVEVTELTQPSPSVEIQFRDPDTGYSGYGPLIIDWGDGTIESYAGGDAGEWWSSLKHTYSEVGQFLIKIIAAEQSCQLYQVSCRYSGGSVFPAILIAKFGDKITLNGVYSSTVCLRDQYRMHWIKLNGKNGLPQNCFYNCYALRKIDIDILPEVIPQHCFDGCYKLKKFDFSKVKEIQSNGLINSSFAKLDLPECVSIDQFGIANNYQLEEINAPVCETVGYGAFQTDYSLEKAVFAEDCTFGSNCFQNCYNLYPRPDGSTN